MARKKVETRSVPGFSDSPVGFDKIPAIESQQELFNEFGQVKADDFSLVGEGFEGSNAFDSEATPIHLVPGKMRSRI